MNEPVIHLIDDDEAIRRSVGFLLRTSGFEVVTYISGIEFLSSVKKAATGCVLLDIRMPAMDGLEVQRAMIDRGIAMPIIMLTGHGEIALAVRAMKAGAIDFIEKPFEKSVLLAAIEQAFSRLDGTDRHRQDAAEAGVQLAALTPRERNVLEGLVRGLPNKTIAYDLGISPRTVEVHRSKLMHKLGAGSLSEVLRIAFSAGLGVD